MTYKFNRAVTVSLLMLSFFAFSFVPAGHAEESESSFYTVQATSYNTIGEAEKAYDKLLAELNKAIQADPGLSTELLDNLRIEYIEPYFTLRAGKFESRKSAVPLLTQVKKIHAKAIILKAYIYESRIKKIWQGGTAGLAAAAPVETTAVVDKASEEPAAVVQEKVVQEETIEKTAGTDIPAAQEDSSRQQVSARPAGAETAVGGHNVLVREKHSDSSYLRYLLLGVIVIIVIVAYRVMQQKQAKKSSGSPMDMTQKELQKMPKLTDALETKLVRNLRELSLFEGNILSVDHNIKTIYVTSSFQKEGKTTAAVSIAYALSLNKAVRVLLVDGNSNSAMIHKLFGTELAPGFSESLGAREIVEGALRGTAYNNLTILPMGAHTSGSTYIETENMKLIVDKLKEQFDYVIYDGHSLMGSSHASIQARVFDGVILVVESEKTKWEVVQQGIDKLKKSRANILGVALNKRKFYIPRFLYGKV